MQGESLDHEWPIPDAKLQRKLSIPSQRRLYYIRYAMKMGWPIERIHELTHIDRWFLAQMKQLVDFEQEIIDVAPLASAFLRNELSGEKIVAPAERVEHRHPRFSLRTRGHLSLLAGAPCRR